MRFKKKNSTIILAAIKAALKRYEDICFQLHDYPPELDETLKKLENELQIQIALVSLLCKELSFAFEKEMNEFKADLFGERDHILEAIDD